MLQAEDPVGDQTGAIDVRKMSLRFDRSTGDYRATLFATGSAAFRGVFRVNLNLYNLDKGTFFSSVLNDYDLATPGARLLLTGSDPVLQGWEAGDRVSTNSLTGTPSPPGIRLFRSSVGGIPGGFLTDEDVIAFADLAQPGIIESIGWWGPDGDGLP